jgi:hypothetical protein
MTAHTTKDDKLQQYNTLPFGSDKLKKNHETWIENKTRGSQEPVAPSSVSVRNTLFWKKKLASWNQIS